MTDSQASTSDRDFAFSLMLQGFALTREQVSLITGLSGSRILSRFSEAGVTSLSKGRGARWSAKDVRRVFFCEEDTTEGAA